MKATLLSELLLGRLEHASSHVAGAQSRHMNRQVYDIIRQEILAGTLPAGSKLPASRQLATEVGISRNTVLFAYEQLLAEGYVTAASGSGTFVTDVFAGEAGASLRRKRGDMGSPAPAQTALPLSRRGEQLVSNASASMQQWGAFVPGVPDVSLFPHHIWARLLNRHWRNMPPALLTYAPPGGYLPLRRALSEHLRLVRSVRCEPEQIVLTTGIHQSLHLIAALLGDRGDQAWIEDPGYWGARGVLRSASIEPVPIPVDEEGLAPSANHFARAPKFILVSPSHQYPLGMVMSLARRQMVLEYARERDVWIIEDDYDSEFRFEGRPLASLQGLDSHDRVIYTGTFSKTLFPGLRMGFMVLPKGLAERFATGLSELYREGQPHQQAVLADFIEQGHYASHVRRVRQRYAIRQRLLREAIAREFGPDWPTSTHEAGLHLVLHLPPDCDDQAISEAALREGLVARALSRYYHSPERASRGLLLGYACVPDDAIAPAFAHLAAVIRPAIASCARP
ncbi:DNA-binding protein [Pandoraea terrae]|uniref:DNA-binding protein n=1 Tax=Pandoraea terrae TaxID=1537710 RepID=A0A5E4TIL3_9BURK|nr:PLP-dependent aminotransferase family protein [Pandoraea terrae]VVD87846.1 DNA-binding protein [Pandoraea terrae]